MSAGLAARRCRGCGGVAAGSAAVVGSARVRGRAQGRGVQAGDADHGAGQAPGHRDRRRVGRHRRARLAERLHVGGEGLLHLGGGPAEADGAVVGRDGPDGEAAGPQPVGHARDVGAAGGEPGAPGGGGDEPAVRRARGVGHGGREGLGAVGVAQPQDGGEVLRPGGRGLADPRGVGGPGRRAVERRARRRAGGLGEGWREPRQGQRHGGCRTQHSPTADGGCHRNFLPRCMATSASTGAEPTIAGSRRPWICRMSRIGRQTGAAVGISPGPVPGRVPVSRPGVPRCVANGARYRDLLARWPQT